MPIPAQLAPTEAPAGATGVFRRDQASAASFGGPEGAALQKVGGAIGQAGDLAAANAIKFQAQQNETEVDQANVQYDTARRGMLFDEDGFYNKKGKTAYDAMQPTAQAIEKLRADTRATLTNPAQQRMFDVMSRRNTEIDLRSMSVHAAQENQQWKVGVAQSTIDNSLAEASAHWNDPVRFARELGMIALQAETRARLTGKSDPEQIQADVQHYTSIAWDHRIRAAMVQNPKLAQQMYEANEGAVKDPNLRQQLEHALSVAVLPGDAREDADKAMAPPGALPAAAPKSGGKTQVGGTGVKTSDVIDGTSNQAQVHQDNIARLTEEIGRKGQTPKNLGILQAELATEQAALKQAQAGGASAPGAPPATSTDEPATVTQPNARDTRAMLSTWIPAAEKLADERHPGNQVYRDMVVQQVKGRVATVTAMQDATERQATDVVKSVIMGAGKPMTMDEVMSNPEAAKAMPLIPIASMRGLVSLLEHNARSARGEYQRSDPKLVNDLRQRIYAADDDPQKITSANQLTPYFAHGLNFADSEHLRKEIQESNTPEGNPFMRQVNHVKTTANRMLTTSMSAMAIAHPELAQEAAYRFGADLDQKITAARKAGKDPADLFVPGSKDYVLDPNRVAAFMPSQSRVAAAKAKDVTVTPNPFSDTPKRTPGETPADYLKRIGK